MSQCFYTPSIKAITVQTTSSFEFQKLKKGTFELRVNDDKHRVWTLANSYNTKIMYVSNIGSQHHRLTS